MQLDLFAACLPGLESLLVDELRGIGAEPKERAGGIAFRGDLELLLRAHLHLGTASHLLLRCGSFRCLNLAQLPTKTAQLPWATWLGKDTPFRVEATAKKSRLYHTGAIAERVTAGIAMALGRPAPAPAPTAAAVQIAVRFVDDMALLSIDTSDTPLHRRGYRLATAKAPLREDLAFALLRAADYRPGQSLLDPLCGAGTIAIEGAAIALGLPPGRLRPAPLQGTAFAAAATARWRELIAAVPTTATAPAGSQIAASDRDDGAIAAARGNAERAGVLAAIAFTACAFSKAPWFEAPATAPRPLLVATNPPYGHRVAAGKDLSTLHQALGHRIQQLGAGVRTALIAHDVRLARRTGIALRRAFATRHGGLAVAVLVDAGAVVGRES